MNVAWALFWGGSRSTKPRVFPCKAAAAGGERYLLCAAVAAGVVSTSNRFPPGVLQRVVVHMCVVLGCFGICGCRSPCNGCMNVVMFCRRVPREMRAGLATSCCKTQCQGCMNVAWGLLWGGSWSTGARSLVFFHVKWLQPAMKGTSCVRRLRLCNLWLLTCA